MKIRPLLRRARAAAGWLAAAYVLFLAAIFIVMRQPPDRFGHIMKRMPMPIFMIVPFETMWNVARGGNLEVGDAAPEFDLRTSDKRGHVALASFRRQQPVVLVFGSYT